MPQYLQHYLRNVYLSRRGLDTALRVFSIGLSAASLLLRFLFLFAPFIVTVEATIIHNVVSSLNAFGFGNRYFFEAYRAGNSLWFNQVFMFNHFRTLFNLLEIVVKITLMPEAEAESDISFSQFMCNPHSRFSSAFAGSK